MTSGATISENCTYIQNPNFPQAYTDATAVSYTIQKSDSGFSVKTNLKLTNIKHFFTL